MSLSDAFRRAHTAKRVNDSVVEISSTYFTHYYDFVQRIVIAGHGAFIPFSQMDREVLIMAHDKLVELGGKPPELPPEAPAVQAQGRKFNL